MAEGIKDAHLLTLRHGAHPGFSKWTQCNHRDPRKWKMGGQKRRVRRDVKDREKGTKRYV